MKANIAKERLEITKQLAGERERELNLNETMTVLKHQADLYQVCFFRKFQNYLSQSTGRNVRIAKRWIGESKIVSILQKPDRETEQPDGRAGATDRRMEGEL